MRSLHLPEAIEATTGSGIPNSILTKAAEIRVKGGYDKIQQMSASNPECLQRNREILDESKRILNEEAQQDQEMRNRFGARWTRKPSAELTKTLWTELNKYEAILGKAMSADETVRQKMETHRQSLMLMSSTDEQLKEAVPSGSISSVLAGNPVVQELTKLCEQAETIKAERDVIESELRNSDGNMTNQFLTALAQDGALDTEAMVGEQLINMYGDLTSQINDSKDRQESLLANLQRCSQEFQLLQKSGAAEEQRSTILNGLQSAYDGFLELNSNLEEGSKFYADLTGILLRLQGKCTDLAFARKTEKDDFLRELTNSATTPEAQGISQPAFHQQSPPPTNQPPQRPPPPQQQQQQQAYAQAPYTSPPPQQPAYPQQPGLAPYTAAPPSQPAHTPAPSGGAPKPAPRRPPQPVQGPPSTYYQAPQHGQYHPYQSQAPMGQQPGYNPFSNPSAPPSYNQYHHQQQPAYPQQPYPGYPPQGQQPQYPAYPPQQQPGAPQPGYNPFAPPSNQQPGGAPPPYPPQ